MDSLRTALRVALAKKNIDQKTLAAPLGLTQQAVSDWGRRGKIPKEYWDYIRETIEIEPADFETPASTDESMTVGDVKASGRSSVEINNLSKNQPSPSIHPHTVTLTDKEFEAFELYRKVGNERLLDKCIAQMRKVESIMDWG